MNPLLCKGFIRVRSRGADAGGIAVVTTWLADPKLPVAKYNQMTRARRDSPRSGCPINQAVELLGDSWTLVVLRDIVFGDRRHFRELLAGSEEGIATNILADRLSRLVEAGVLTRESSGRGRRARYSLTEQGIRTVPILAELATWGLDHTSGEHRLRARAEVLRDGGSVLMSSLMSDLRYRHLGVGEPDPTPRELLERAVEAADG